MNQQNDYGFTVGGPVWIPHVYNGRNRTFFHFSLDWFRQNQALNTIGTVPSAAMKTGRLFQLRGLVGYTDPHLRSQHRTAVSRATRFPRTRFSALSQSLLASIPDPDTAGINGGLVSNKLPADSLHPHPPEPMGLHHRREPDQLAEHPFQPVAGHDQLAITSLRRPLCHPANPLQSQVDNTNDRHWISC